MALASRNRAPKKSASRQSPDAAASVELSESGMTHREVLTALSGLLLGMFVSMIASISVGVALFGTSVFLSQYMQLARGATPTESGLLTIPMMAGVLISSTVIGALVSRRGKWKAFMVVGSSLLIVGVLLLTQLQYDTDFWYVGISMFVLGAGVGMVMQNLVLVVQNTTAVKNMGVATSAVTFFRSLGGTIGVSVMGSILGTVVAENIKTGIGGLPPEQQAVAAQTLGSGAIPQISQLPDFLRVIVESAYGAGVGSVFLAAAPLAIITLIAVAFLPNAKLGTLTAIQRAQTEGPSDDAPGTLKRELEDAEDILIEVGAASAGLAPVGLAHPTGSIRVQPDADRTSGSPATGR